MGVRSPRVRMELHLAEYAFSCNGNEAYDTKYDTISSHSFLQ
jgi:hypothetical protein